MTHHLLTPDGPGKAVSRLADGADAVTALRARWAEHINAAYVAAGADLRQDHRSYRDQGIDRVPTRHLGPTTLALERRGVRTERGDAHRVHAEARTERRRAELAIALLDGEQQRRVKRHQRPPPPAAPPSAPTRSKPPQQETPAMTKKYTPRGRVTGHGGRPPRRPPEQREPKNQHEQTDDLRAWLWTQAYAPAAMPRDWLRSTSAMWTFGRDGDPDGIYAQLAGDAGRLYDSGSAVTWDHAGAATDEERAVAVEAMLDMAIEGRGWEALSFFGSQQFREEAARAATRRGVSVSDGDLQGVVEEERRRLAEQQGATPTPKPGAITGGIAQAAPVPMAVVAASVAPAQPSPTVAAFLAAGKVARTSGADADEWLSLYAARLTEAQRAEIAAHLATQHAASARWERAANDALTADALTAAQQRGDIRALRAVLDVTPTERRRIVGDVLHERANAASDGDPSDLADLRRRSAAQALAQTWDKVCDEVERSKRKDARVTECPPTPPTDRNIRALGEALLTARHTERNGVGDPLDTLRAERALAIALDRSAPDVRRTLSEALTERRHSDAADLLTSTLAVAALAAGDRAAGLAGLSDDQRAALRPPRPGQAEDEAQNAAEMEAPHPNFTEL